MFGRAGGPCRWSNGGRVRVFQKVLVKCPTSVCFPGGFWKAGSCATCAFERCAMPARAFAGILADLPHTLDGQMTNSFSKSRMCAHFDHCVAVARPRGRCATFAYAGGADACTRRPRRIDAIGFGPPRTYRSAHGARHARRTAHPPPGTPDTHGAQHARRPVVTPAARLPARCGPRCGRTRRIRRGCRSPGRSGPTPSRTHRRSRGAGWGCRRGRGSRPWRSAPGRRRC